jgi:aryl-alcohol dehydrogenase-like predicted oxidoreductase
MAQQSARRRILKALAAAAAMQWQPSIAKETTSMLQRPIPTSGELLPAVGLGTYSTFDVGNSAAERANLKEVLRLFVQHGGKLVDSSPMYGSSESVVGDVAREEKLTDRLFMATKVWTSGRDAGIGQMNESMRRMGVTRMDLMQVHNLLDLQTHAKTLRDWKAQGKIRYLGITHYNAGAHDELERLVKTKQYDFVQFNYSIAEREAEQRLLPACAESGTAVIINRPFAQANLFSRVRGKELPAWASEFDCTSWAQFFLKYILAHPAVTCVIPATSKPKHLVDNMQAGLGRMPDAVARRKMAESLD